MPGALTWSPMFAADTVDDRFIAIAASGGVVSAAFPRLPRYRQVHTYSYWDYPTREGLDLGNYDYGIGLWEGALRPGDEGAPVYYQLGLTRYLIGVGQRAANIIGAGGEPTGGRFRVTRTAGMWLEHHLLDGDGLPRACP